MFTALAARSARTVSEMTDCSIIRTFPQRARTGVSVGENAVLVLKAIEIIEKIRGPVLFAHFAFCSRGSGSFAEKEMHHRCAPAVYHAMWAAGVEPPIPKSKNKNISSPKKCGGRQIAPQVSQYALAARRINSETEAIIPTLPCR